MCLPRQQRKKQLWIVLRFFFKEEGKGGKNFQKKNTFRKKKWREPREMPVEAKRYQKIRRLETSP